MEYTARLVHGPHKLDLNDGTYSVFDFDFPDEAVALGISTGSSANRLAGGRVTSRRFSDRSWAPSIIIRGTSELETQYAARRLRQFFELTADTRYEMYFEYMPHRAYSAVPAWGQDRLRFHVKYGRVLMDASYYVADIPQKMLVVPLDLLIGPHAYGLRQKLATAKGFVAENTVGAPDGTSRGVIVASGTTNKITNPIFGHATWDTNWSTGADLLTSANSDPEYILWGQASAKIRRVTGGANRIFSHSLNAGNTNSHNLSAYVKRHDGSAISAADLRLYYNNSLLTTVYTPLGDGWYLMSAVVSGVASLTNCGIYVVATNVTYYAAGVQFTETSGLIEMIHGDLLGCAWTGTPHASTSTSTAGSVRVPTADIFNSGSGTIRIAVRHLQAYDRSLNAVLFSDGTLIASYDSVDDKWSFTDGTNSVGSSGAAQSFASGDIQILHFVWGPAGKQIYLNGALYDTSATLAAWNAGNNLYIGSSSSSSQHFNGTILGFKAWAVSLTAGEISADYAISSELARGGDGFGQRLDAVPYIWTKDGDNVVDNCNDSTRDNWAVCAGIPGNVEADTTFHLTLADTVKTVLLSRFDTYDFIDPGNLYYDTFAVGESTPDATCSGGQYYAIAVTAGVPSQAMPATRITNNHVIEAVLGREYELAIRLYDVKSGDTLMVNGFVYNGSEGSLVGDIKTVAASQVWRLVRTHPIFSQQLKSTTIPFTRTHDYVMYAEIERGIIGSTAVNVDYVCALPRPIVRLGNPSWDNPAQIIYHDRHADGLASNNKFLGQIDVQGDDIALIPGKFNTLISLLGMEANVAATITWTMTYTAVYIIPRWGLM